MPDLPIIDAHLHLWNPDTLRIPWLDAIDLLNRPYDLATYQQHTGAVAVEAMVYVQVDAAPAYAISEVQWVAAQARQDPRLQGIVAFAPLEDGLRVGVYLDTLVGVSPLVKGVRRIVQDEADPAFCLQPGFVAGVHTLARYGLSCDLCIAHHQLAATVELVRRCPEVQFMLDHLGKPGIRAGLRDPWHNELAELAGLPNVLCKVSGLATEADHKNWSDADLAPYVAHALTVFGEDRVVFGGDWPVLLLAGSYARWVASLDALTIQLAPAARRKLWAENARRFYKLPASQ